MNDITSFMTWFISEVVKLFSGFFNILDSITFFGTSLLKLSLTILILSALLPIVLTIANSTSFIASKSEKVFRSIDSYKNSNRKGEKSEKD